MTHFPVMEHFYSLQGEGYNTGRAAYFIRLAGCSVGCHWCDVKESWDANYPELSVEQLLALVEGASARHLVITGGEPLLYNLEELCTAARRKGIKLWLETSGSEGWSGCWDWAVLSPKKNKLPLAQAYAQADELKMIIHNQHDFIFAQDQARRVKPRCLLFIQAEWSRQTVLMPHILNYIKANPEWRLSLQTHKYLAIP